MIQNANVEWTTNKASIVLVGEWDLLKRTCWYWSEDQTRKNFVKP